MLQPDIVEGHNLDQAIMTIRDNVTKILQDLTFLLATKPNENVSFNLKIILMSRDKCFFLSQLGLPLKICSQIDY